MILGEKKEEGLVGGLPALKAIKYCIGKSLGMSSVHYLIYSST